MDHATQVSAGLRPAARLSLNREISQTFIPPRESRDLIMLGGIEIDLLPLVLH